MSTLITVSKEGDTYQIESPLIPELFTQARSPEDLLNHLQDALDLMVENYDSRHDEVVANLEAERLPAGATEGLPAHPDGSSGRWPDLDYE